MKNCGHCGYSGELDHIQTVEVERRTQELPDYGDVGWVRYWMLYRCPECAQPTLVSDWWSDEFGDVEAETWEPIFPTPRDNAAVPQIVLARYQQAKLVKHRAPALYAVGVRVALEAICKDKGAQGKDLFHQLDDLAGSGQLPQQLAEMGHQLRDLGNLGAHVTSVEVTAEDVPVIEDFAEAIIEYVYRAPGKISAAKASLDVRRAAASP